MAAVRWAARNAEDQVAADAEPWRAAAPWKWHATTCSSPPSGGWGWSLRRSWVRGRGGADAGGALHESADSPGGGAAHSGCDLRERVWHTLLAHARSEPGRVGRPVRDAGPGQVGGFSLRGRRRADVLLAVEQRSANLVGQPPHLHRPLP